MNVRCIMRVSWMKCWVFRVSAGFCKTWRMAYSEFWSQRKEAKNFARTNEEKHGGQK